MDAPRTPHEPPTVRTKDQARQGRPRGIVRYVLGVSLALVVIGMILAYLLVF